MRLKNIATYAAVLLTISVIVTIILSFMGEQAHDQEVQAFRKITPSTGSAMEQRNSLMRNRVAASPSQSPPARTDTTTGM